jgi:hypothetical protein
LLYRDDDGGGGGGGGDGYDDDDNDKACKITKAACENICTETGVHFSSLVYQHIRFTINKYERPRY